MIFSGLFTLEVGAKHRLITLAFDAMWLTSWQVAAGCGQHSVIAGGLASILQMFSVGLESQDDKYCFLSSGTA